jgi:hypothetical protein
MLLLVAMGIASILLLLLGRRHWREMDKEMETIIKTKRPVPARTATKAVHAITALVLGTVAFDLLASTFNTIETFWQATFLLEAGIWFALSLFPFISNFWHGTPIRGDPGVKLWVIVLMTAAAIFLFLSFLVAYIT